MIFKFYRASFFVGMIGKKPSQESLDCQTKNQISKCSDYECLRFLPTSKNEKCENIYLVDSNEFSEFIRFESSTKLLLLSGAKDFSGVKAN